MRTELISIATDALPLDGAFYLPESEPCALGYSRCRVGGHALIDETTVT